MNQQKKNFLTYLNINYPQKQRPVFIPVSFVTKNQPIIVSLNFQEIALAITAKDGHIKSQHFHNHAGAICCMFEDHTSFLLGIGMMLPAAIAIDQIDLDLRIAVADQVGRTTTFKIDLRLKGTAECMHLISSQTSRIK